MIDLPNLSDWSRNVAAAGGCTIRLDGRDYQATQPEFLSRDEARELIKPMYSPVMRAGFRMLGIRQFMRLDAKPIETGDQGSDPGLPVTSWPISAEE